MPAFGAKSSRLLSTSSSNASTRASHCPSFPHPTSIFSRLLSIHPSIHQSRSDRPPHSARPPLAAISKAKRKIKNCTSTFAASHPRLAPATRTFFSIFLPPSSFLSTVLQQAPSTQAACFSTSLSLPGILHQAMAGIYRSFRGPPPPPPPPEQEQRQQQSQHHHATPSPRSSRTGSPHARTSDSATASATRASGSRARPSSAASSTTHLRSRDRRENSGRWLADEPCSNCGKATQESDLYCSEQCRREELESARRRESDQYAKALADAAQQAHLTAVQAHAFQAIADVDIDDDAWQRKKVHRHSLPLPFATQRTSAAHMQHHHHHQQQHSPTERLQALSSSSSTGRQRSPVRLRPNEAAGPSATSPLTTSAVETIKDAMLPFSTRRYSHILRPRPPPSDASSSSLASLPQPPLLYHRQASAKPTHASRAAPTQRCSSTSSFSSGQQCTASYAPQRRSRSRSSTMSETTSTSDDAYTTGPGTPSPAIKPSHGLGTAAGLGYPSVIHEDDSEPTLLSLPPSISSPSAVLLAQPPSGGPLKPTQDAHLEHLPGFAPSAATYTNQRSPVLLPLHQYQQPPVGRPGSKSNPSTPWRNSIPLPDALRHSPALVPVMSPATQVMRFARRPSSTAMPRTAAHAALGVTTSSAAYAYADAYGNPISALSSPVLTPTSGRTASTTPTPSVGHFPGLTSSSMPHAPSFFRPHPAASPALVATTTATAAGGATSYAVAHSQSTIRASQTGTSTAAAAMASAAAAAAGGVHPGTFTTTRRNTRERIGLMTPAFPVAALSRAPSSNAGFAATSSQKLGQASPAAATRHSRSRSLVNPSFSAVKVGGLSKANSTAHATADSSSDFARSTSEEDNGADLDDDDDVLSDLELDGRDHDEMRGRSHVSIASRAGSRGSFATARSSVTATAANTTAVPAAEQGRGRSRAPGERSSSRRGRSPPRGAARTDDSAQDATATAPEEARGRSRAQGERSSSRRGRSPPRGGARTEHSLSRLSHRTSSDSSRLLVGDSAVDENAHLNAFGRPEKKHLSSQSSSSPLPDPASPPHQSETANPHL
ncbi:hypothetical protein V8E36_007541 [Tilletia maclaganii]